MLGAHVFAASTIVNSGNSNRHIRTLLDPAIPTSI